MQQHFKGRFMEDVITSAFIRGVQKEVSTIIHCLKEEELKWPNIVSAINHKATISMVDLEGGHTKGEEVKALTITQTGETKGGQLSLKE